MKYLFRSCAGIFYFAIAAFFCAAFALPVAIVLFWVVEWVCSLLSDLPL